MIAEDNQLGTLNDSKVDFTKEWFRVVPVEAQKNPVLTTLHLLITSF